MWATRSRGMTWKFTLSPSGGTVAVYERSSSGLIEATSSAAGICPGGNLPRRVLRGEDERTRLTSGGPNVVTRGARQLPLVTLRTTNTTKHYEKSYKSGRIDGNTEWQSKQKHSVKLLRVEVIAGSLPGSKPVSTEQFTKGFQDIPSQAAVDTMMPQRTICSTQPEDKTTKK
ncbi:hypothetical protein F2P81_018275 [Scophthalmus maximus]|uniref:Uncharacterized protein n=1 Tax=Scophthalmus maximus TaxID=52904 RepID=A0A6A4SBR9_SCOMX|nr:hypothetical protein F2P81_018275 [Scophthalmus maximus]